MLVLNRMIRLRGYPGAALVALALGLLVMAPAVASALTMRASESPDEGGGSEFAIEIEAKAGARYLFAVALDEGSVMATQALAYPESALGKHWVWNTRDIHTTAAMDAEGNVSATLLVNSDAPSRSATVYSLDLDLLEQLHAEGYGDGAIRSALSSRIVRLDEAAPGVPEPGAAALFAAGLAALAVRLRNRR